MGCLLSCSLPQLAHAQSAAPASATATPPPMVVSPVGRLGEASIALLKRVSGKVELLRGGQVVTPVAGEPLQRADVLRTGPKSSAGISFVDGTTLAVDADSTVELRRYTFQPERGQYDFDLYLQRGAAIYSSGKLGKLAPEAVQVRTPSALIGVRGTRFHVSAQ
jgi:hypothetical protein